jgi:hypothetical protein
VGIQTGMWLTSFLWCIAIYSFEFAIFYAVSALFGVWTRSPILSILSVIVVWGYLCVVGWGHWGLVEFPSLQAAEGAPPLVERQWYVVGFEVLHAISPRYKDIDWLTARAIKAEMLRPDDITKAGAEEAYKAQLEQLDKEFGSYSWSASLGVSCAFIAVVLALTLCLFTFRDY